MKTLEENALLIATFEGYKTFHENGYWQIHYSEDNERTAIDTAYHSDWNWLMVVVEKIEEIALTDTATCKVHRFRVNMEYNQCHIIDTKTDDIVGEGEVGKLDSTYKAVIEFINWYNSQSK